MSRDTASAAVPASANTSRTWASAALSWALTGSGSIALPPTSPPTPAGARPWSELPARRHHHSHPQVPGATPRAPARGEAPPAPTVTATGPPGQVAGNRISRLRGTVDPWGGPRTPRIRRERIPLHPPRSDRSRTRSPDSAPEREQAAHMDVIRSPHVDPMKAPWAHEYAIGPRERARTVTGEKIPTSPERPGRRAPRRPARTPNRRPRATGSSSAGGCGRDLVGAPGDGADGAAGARSQRHRPQFSQCGVGGRRAPRARSLRHVARALPPARPRA